MTASIPQLYRLPFFGGPERQFRNCLLASSAGGLLLMIVLLVAPTMVRPIQSVEEVSERFAKLIIERREPVKEPPPATPGEGAPAGQQEEPLAIVESEPAERSPEVERPGARIAQTPPPESSAGNAGRARAQAEVADQLEEVQGALGAVLADLSTSLKKQGNAGDTPARRGGRTPRSVRAARTAVAASTENGRLGGGRGEGVSATSALTGSSIQIASTAGGGLSGVEGGRSGSESGSGTAMAGVGEFRSNASLLSVIRKYSSGIQFCYDQALNRQPGLRGKLVVSITVAPSGVVTQAAPAGNTLGDAQLVECALAQIEGWRFPVIPEGVVTFRAPFLFTPPG